MCTDCILMERKIVSTVQYVQYCTLTSHPDICLRLFWDMAGVLLLDFVVRLEKCIFKSFVQRTLHDFFSFANSVASWRPRPADCGGVPFPSGGLRKFAPFAIIFANMGTREFANWDRKRKLPY